MTETESEERVVHFCADGFTALARVWSRGEELRVRKGSRDWERTLDPETGRSWLDLDEDEQDERWGRVMFREGAWPGTEPVDPERTHEAERLEAWEALRDIRDPDERARALKRVRRRYGELSPGPSRARIAAGLDDTSVSPLPAR